MLVAELLDVVTQYVSTAAARLSGGEARSAASSGSSSLSRLAATASDLRTSISGSALQVVDEATQKHDLLGLLIVLGGAELFLVPLQSADEGVRVAALGVINRLLRHPRGIAGLSAPAAGDAPSDGVDGGSASSAGGGSSSGGGTFLRRRSRAQTSAGDREQTRRAFASTLEGVLVRHTLTPAVSGALFALLDGDVSRRRLQSSRGSAAVPESDEPRVLRRAWLLPTVLTAAHELATGSADGAAGVAARLLSDVGRLLARAEENSAALLAYAESIDAQWVRANRNLSAGQRRLTPRADVVVCAAARRRRVAARAGAASGGGAAVARAARAQEWLGAGRRSADAAARERRVV